MNLFLYSVMLGGAVIVGGCIVLVASWYDLRAAARRPRLAATVRRLRTSHQPLIAILLDVRNAQLADLSTSLASITQSRYKRFSICIVDERPRLVFKQYISAYNKRRSAISLRYYSPRQPLAPASAFRLAYQRMPKHDLLLTLTAGDTVQPMTIKQAVAHFSDNTRLGALKLTRRTPLTYNVSSLILRYEEAGSELLQKAIPSFPRRTTSPLQSGVLYRHTYVLPRKQQTMYHARYDSSLVVTGHASLFTRLPHHLAISWLLSVTTIYLSTYAFVAAATLQSSSLLLLTWATVCAWTLTALWLETATPLRQKFVLTYGILLAPLLVYLRAGLAVIVLPVRALSGPIRQWHRTRYNTYRDRYQRYILDNILAFKTWYEEMCPREVWYQDQRRADD